MRLISFNEHTRMSLQPPDHSSVMSNPVFHIVSLGTVLGSVAGILPPLAALAAILWYSIQVWESKTVQAWRARWHRGKHEV